MPIDERPRVADVRARVDGRAADVHPHRARRRRQLDRATSSTCQRAASIRTPQRIASSRGSARSPPRAPARARVRSARRGPRAGRHRPPSARAARSFAESLSSTSGSARPQLDEPLERLGARLAPAGSGLYPAVRGSSRRAPAPRPGRGRRAASGAASSGTPTRAASSSSSSAPSIVDRERPDALEIEVDVVAGQAELLEVGAHRLGRDTRLPAARRRRRRRRAWRASSRRRRGRARGG